MAQTKKKRRRKHKGTQGGRIDRRPARGRPRNRAEAQARAKNRGKGKGGQRTLTPPTWGSAARKGLLAGLIFFVLLALAFGRPPLESAALAGFIGVGFYIPMAYYTDRFFYSRQIRKEEQARIEKTQRRTSGDDAE